jgi:hypothetical protein
VTQQISRARKIISSPGGRGLARADDQPGDWCARFHSEFGLANLRIQSGGGEPLRHGAPPVTVSAVSLQMVRCGGVPAAPVFEREDEQTVGA